MRNRSSPPTTLMPRLVPSTAVFLAAALALPAPAGEVSVRGVEVGFGGAYKAGEWTPLTVDLAAGSASAEPLVIETVTTDPEGAAVVRRSVAQPTGRGGAPAVGTVFQSGRVGSDLTLRLRSKAGELLAETRYRTGSASLPPALPKGRTLWVTGGMTGTKDAPVVSLPVPDGIAAARLGDALPVDPVALSAADLLIIRGDLAPGPAEAEAIRQWVADGGHLVVSLGSHTQTFRAGPLAAWIPVELAGEFRLFDLTRIEAYSRSNRRPPRSRGVTAARLGEAAVTLLGDPTGESEPRLIVRSPHGFGRVTLFAFDLDAPPFANWEGLPAVLARALVEQQAAPPKTGRTDDAGVTDLSTQLLRAEESSFGIERPTTGRALLLLLAYAAIVGPLDYLLVHRLLRRPALTWVTLPLIVLGGAWWLDRAAVASGGTSSRVNQLDLVDLDAETGTLRGHTSLTLYSAASTRGDVTVRPDWRFEGPPAVPRLAWAAPPEETFGGTYREGAGGFFRPEYLFPQPADSARAERLPLLVAASRQLAATWRQDGAAGLIDARLVDRGRAMLEGPVVHRLPGTLTDFVVVFGDRIYVPRESEWHPGDPLDLGSSAFQRQDLDTFLTRAQTKQLKRKPTEGGETFIVTAGEYDPHATDLDAIVRMLTFHGVVGGRAYTGLTNVARPSDDLTPLLRSGRAVLVSGLDRPAMRVEAESGEAPPFSSSATTFVRIVLTPRRDSSAGPPSLAPTETTPEKPPAP